MTVDKVKLKALAEAATQGEWAKHEGRLGGVVYGGPVQHWVRGSGQSQIAMTTGAEWMRPGENESNAAFIAAANPAAVLVLLTENERLAHLADCWDRLNIHNKAIGDSFQAERDQLKAKLSELISAVRSINHGPAHRVVVPGDDEPQYRQRKEWIEWILELCDTAMPADKKTGD